MPWQRHLYMVAFCFVLQDDAVALVLRHPHLASTQQQLAHLASLVHDLPDTISMQLDQWQATLVKRPELAHYSSVAALSAKYKAIRALFPGGGTPCS